MAMRSNATDQTKLSTQDWRDLILAELKGRGRDPYYSAVCPICLIAYDVEILGRDAPARTVAVDKVSHHIKSAHSDALAD